jgi:hypothetical protein
MIIFPARTSAMAPAMRSVSFGSIVRTAGAYSRVDSKRAT